MTLIRKKEIKKLLKTHKFVMDRGGIGWGAGHLEPRKPLNKQRKTTVAQAKRAAWKAFSLYVRTRDSVDGVNECYTCGNIFPISELQAGHGLGGRSNAVLFNEDCVRPQCRGCNIFGGGKYPIFTRKLIEELGLDGYDQLVKDSNQIVKYTLSDYLELARYYSEQTKV